MSAAHLHLALNHIPVLGTLFGAVLLALGLWRTNDTIQQVGFGVLVLAGAGAIAVYLTGEPAEEVVEGVAGVSHDAIEAHEEWGWYALLAGLGTGVFALGALLLQAAGRRLAAGLRVFVLVLALLTSGVMAYAANLGGKVHHPELRAAPTAIETPDTYESDPPDEYE